MKECCIILAAKAARPGEEGAREAAGVLDLFLSGEATCSINGDACTHRKDEKSLHGALVAMGRSDIVPHLRKRPVDA